MSGVCGVCEPNNLYKPYVKGEGTSGCLLQLIQLRSSASMGVSHYTDHFLGAGQSGGARGLSQCQHSSYNVKQWPS